MKTFPVQDPLVYMLERAEEKPVVISRGVDITKDEVKAMRESIQRAMQPVTNGHEWIEWNGGENPVPGKIVEVRCRAGFEKPAYYSQFYRWSHVDANCNISDWNKDIVAYRVRESK